MSYGQDPLHDEVNLTLLVRRLEKATAEKWDESQSNSSWFKAQSTLQKVKYARRLLKNVDLFTDNKNPELDQRLDQLRTKLGKVETFAKGVAQRTEPENKRPTPILPTLPQPDQPRSLTLDLAPNDSAENIRTDDLLLPADTPVFPSSTNIVLPTPMTLLPATAKTATSTAVARATTSLAARHLAGSTAVQQELSDQLAEMAAQLKRNAIHFSDSLVRDQAVVEETSQKIEGNFDVMQKERIRLRDHRGKSGSTTCLVVAIVLVVLLLFVLMVSVIRFTRR